MADGGRTPSRGHVPPSFRQPVASPRAARRGARARAVAGLPPLVLPFLHHVSAKLPPRFRHVRGFGVSSALLSPETVAQRWGVPKAHVYRLTRSGALRAVKLGRYCR